MTTTTTTMAKVTSDTRGTPRSKATFAPSIPPSASPSLLPRRRSHLTISRAARDIERCICGLWRASIVHGEADSDGWPTVTGGGVRFLRYRRGGREEKDGCVVGIASLVRRRLFHVESVKIHDRSRGFGKLRKLRIYDDTRLHGDNSCTVGHVSCCRE